MSIYCMRSVREFLVSETDEFWSLYALARDLNEQVVRLDKGEIMP
jgi:hypothetical protein